LIVASCDKEGATVGKKVLVVEDEPTLLETLEYNLTRQGYDVCTVTDGLARFI
jgi:DNA-binding response OmpR family regulator